MKQLIKAISPKRLFRSKKGRSIRSDPLSYSSSSSSDSSSSGFHQKRSADNLGTPPSVLPDLSGDWSDVSSDFFSELVQAFKLMDNDNDGIVSRTQLESLLIRLGAEEEVATMLSEVDRDGDGCISVEALMSRIGGPACEPAGDDELRVAFEFFDTDHDGKITAEELMGVYKAIGDERCTLDDCRRMIAGVDKNGDGFVCFEDFARMMELQR
ncbi:probable calcium-binding protein CML35 [Ricinus communis]|uniref:Calcium-binding allergen Ole e, putative n=1 Tax=Ricinus communis TaxID=3988 RepID=B9T832_RICCO|nr:probable calcium-binding protein CML35 [Ricinus communis]EEF27979.1 Calcium-binding allergen Ole e, putative [Ricinus communis]|eukprot:XP_002534401.1 probable calcium-binding protein CML35 [Ricinus communis]